MVALLGLGVSLGWSTRRLVEGDLTFRLRMRGEDELVKLGHAFDSMAARIEMAQRDLAGAKTTFGHHFYISIFSDISILSPCGARCPRGDVVRGRGMAGGLRLLVDQLKAVSHPLRLRVLALLGSGELCVCQVAEVLQVPTSSISEALRELRRAGFVKERKEGRWVFVSLVLNGEASPLLAGILAEALPVTEAAEDRLRAVAVKALSIPALCGHAQKPLRGR